MSSYTVLSSINNLGQIVGYYESPASGGYDRGFVNFGRVQTPRSTIRTPQGALTQIRSTTRVRWLATTTLRTSASIIPVVPMVSTPTSSIPVRHQLRHRGSTTLVISSGRFTDSSGNTHGFIDNKGNYTQIDYPGATFTGETTLNDYGQLAGFYTDASGETHGFLDDHNVFSTIDPPGSSYTVVWGTDSFGNLVGIYDDASGWARIPRIRARAIRGLAAWNCGIFALESQFVGDFTPGNRQAVRKYVWPSAEAHLAFGCVDPPPDGHRNTIEITRETPCGERMRL